MPVFHTNSMPRSGWVQTWSSWYREHESGWPDPSRTVWLRMQAFQTVLLETGTPSCPIGKARPETEEDEEDRATVAPEPDGVMPTANQENVIGSSAGDWSSIVKPVPVW